MNNLTVQSNKSIVMRVFAILLIAVMVLAFMPLNASAKAKTKSYIVVTKTPTKVGKYYYKLTSNKAETKSYILRSKKKKSGYKKIMNIDFYERVATNGKYIYRVKENSAETKAFLFRYNAAGKKPKKVKTFKADSWFHSWELSMAYGKYIFLTESKESTWGLHTHRYNTESKRINKVKDYCGIVTYSKDYRKIKEGAYFLAEREMNSAGVCASAKDLCKITSAGKIKKVKALGGSVDAAIVGKKVYYVKFRQYEDGGYDLVNASVYRCNLNGSSNKCFGDLDFEYDGGELHADCFTSKTCRVRIDDQEHTFIYSKGEFW